jgi:ferredoxin
MTVYRIEIDRALCSGFGSCARLAPEVIDLDRGGIASVRVGVTSDENVLDAAASCPMGAIAVREVEAA